MYQEKKEQLQILETELVNRLNNLNKDLSKSHSSDSGEQAVERENDEVIESLRNETEIELSQVRKALTQITDGEYGSCQRCGEAINTKRLDAMPYSTLCIKCAEEQS